MRNILAFAFLLVTTPALAQNKMPDTPAGRAAQDWLTALNTGDSAAVAALNTRYQRDTPPSGMLLKSSFTVKPEDQFASLTVMHEGAQRPPELAIPRLSQSAINATLDARANQAVKDDKLSGAMLAERGGKTIYKRNWGLANRETGAPVTDATKFRIGSMNKMFTAVAALQLVDQGKLSLDGTVGQYLPDYPNRDIAAKVTIRHLLNHSGGTGDFFGPEFDKHRLTLLKNNEDYVTFFGSRAPAFEPGSEERYSNYGMILLGHIVQKVSGEDYYTYIDRHVFAPAGMAGSGSRLEIENVPDLSRGYMQKDGKWVSNADTLPQRGMAAGGGYSTAQDLIKFARALVDGTLLPKYLLEQATSYQTKGKWYGFGFSVYGEGAGRSFGHNGGAPGQNGELRIFPTSRTFIVALANVDPPAATSLVDFYANRVPLN